MNRRNEDTLDEIIMQIASLNASEESVHRVTTSLVDQAIPIAEERRRSRQQFIERTIAIACIILVGIAAPIFLPTLTAGSANTFAAMQQHVQETQSVQYYEVIGETGIRLELNRLASMLEMIHIEMKAVGETEEPPHVVRMRKRIKHLEESLDKKTRVVVRRVAISGRYLQRTERWGEGTNSRHISNAETGVNITLYPFEKRCVVMKTQTVLNMKSGEKRTDPIKPAPERNLYAQIREIPEEEVIRVGPESIDGVFAQGYRQTTLKDGFEFVRTFWADRQTQLPVRIDAVVKRDGEIIGESSLTNFVFDQKLDPALFDTKPPKGYSVSEGGFMSLDPGESAE